MDKDNELTFFGGEAPQNARASQGEVDVTHATAVFLSLLSNPSSSPLERDLAAADCGLTPKQSSFVQTWVRCRGDLVEISEKALLSPGQVQRLLAVPAVFQLLSEAAKRDSGLPGPVASKEELESSWTLIARNEAMPLSFQGEAREQLAKLLGYYPAGQDGSNVAIQINLKGGLADG